MTRLQFIIVTVLASVVAICLFLQMFLAHASALDESRLRLTGEALEEGQLDYNRLQQLANLTASVASQKDDQALRDVLIRNNIQVKAPTPPSASNPAPAPATPTSSTH